MEERDVIMNGHSGQGSAGRFAYLGKEILQKGQTVDPLQSIVCGHDKLVM